MSTVQEVSPWHCDHQEIQVRRRVYANGTRVACKQCLRCGSSLGCIPKAEVILSQLPAWDDSLSTQWREQGQARFDAQKAAEREAFWEWYDEYLRSPEWRSLRARVFKRANGVCEGCLSRPAIQAHHLTYERVGHEMLFDLVAVCKECHDQIHESRNARLPQKG